MSPCFFSRNFSDTDETDCEMWPCTAPYSRCNGLWNRPNGCDELNCPSPQKTSCADNEHSCAFFNSTIMGCFSLARAGDRHFDCLFGIDERATLLSYEHMTVVDGLTTLHQVYRFYWLRCWNNFNVRVMPQ
jgi:hypothetical protein